MGLDSIVIEPSIWDGYRGFHFSVQLNGRETRESALNQIESKLREFYQNFGAQLKRQESKSSDRRYHVKLNGEYRATLILHDKSSWSRRKKDLPNRDYPAASAKNRSFQNYWISVPRMADESKRQEHVQLLADYLKRGLAAVVTYRYCKARQRQSLATG